MSVSPKLIHPVDVYIETLNRADTEFDEDADEEVKSLDRDEAIKIDGQPRWYTKGKLRPNEIGFIEGSSGYIVMRRKDMTTKNYTPESGDRITQIGEDTVNLYVMGMRPMGHYGRKSKLIALDFADSEPTRIGD